MKLYMEVTTDKYELPLAVAPTIRELARITGTNANNISACITRARKRGWKSKYIVVEIEGGDTPC